MPGLLLCGFNVKSPELLKGGGDPPSEEAGPSVLTPWMGVGHLQISLQILFPLLGELNPVKKLTGQIKNQCGLH